MDVRPEGARIGAQPPGHGKAVQPWQDQIQQHASRRLFPRHGQRLAAVPCLGTTIAATFLQQTQGGAEEAVVLDDENVHGVGGYGLKTHDVSSAS
jgi:hypothetical protein